MADFVACHKQSYMHTFDIANEVKPGGSMDLAGTDSSEDSDTAGGARADAEEDDGPGEDEAVAGNEPASDGEDNAESRFRMLLSEETFDEIKQIAPNERFAVRNGAQWGVVDMNGREVHAPEYDFIETDGNGLFSLTKKDGDVFDAKLMYYDTKTGEDSEVFTNEQYPEYDFTEFYTPYLTMSARGTDQLDMIFVEADHTGGSDFAFYRLSRFDRNAIISAGMDVSRWESASGFMQNMTTDGGSFISAKDWVDDGTGYTNVVGIDGVNQIVLSEAERDRTIQMLPYAADDTGFYAAYIVELPSEKKTLAYGSVKNPDFAAAGLTPFPSEAEEVIPDLSGGTARAGKNGRVVLADKDGDEAIFNMTTGKAETAFSYRSVLLSGDTRYPSVARENKKYVYITPEGETRDDGDVSYTAASLYDEEAGCALVTDADGNLFAIDRNGRQVSGKEEDFADSKIVYLHGGDSHTFAVETNGKVRICVLREE